MSFDLGAGREWPLRHPHSELTAAVARLIDVDPMYGISPLIRTWIERCRSRRPGEGDQPAGSPAG